MKKPKYVQDIIKHLTNCFEEKNTCLHCVDCIAFALMYAEDNDLQLLPPGVAYVTGGGKIWNFQKFLLSTIVNEPGKEYLPCPRALKYAQVYRFSKWLLRLTKEEKKKFRTGLITHDEFAFKNYSLGLFRFKKNSY